jgi:hypothetical protein
MEISKMNELYELDNSYASGFDDAKQKALDILHNWIYGPFKEEQQVLARKILSGLRGEYVMAKRKTGRKLPRRMVDPTGWSTERLKRKKKPTIERESPEKLHDFKKDTKKKKK